MKLLFLILFLPAAAAAQRSVWLGTNSQCEVRVVVKPDGYGTSFVRIAGQSHPASTYKGANGWVTLDYGAGADPSRIVQFRIVETGPTVMKVQTEGGETFFLHRKQ